MDDITIEFDVPATMRDGTVLRATVYRPARGGPFPVLLTRTPYDRNAEFDNLLNSRDLARAGYIVVHQDTRGRFASEGEWLPWKHERDDGYDSVEWAATLPGSNGRVGMFGQSYVGSTQWSAAVTKPPHLAAIAPSLTWSEPEDGLMFRGGAIEHGLNTFWALLTALAQIPKAHESAEEMMTHLVGTMTDLERLDADGYHQLPSGALPVLAATGQPDIGVARALADRSTTEECRVSSRYDDADVPSLNHAGWYDVFLQGSIDNYVAMRARGRAARLIVGPWDHFSHDGANRTRVGDTNFGYGSLTPGGLTSTAMHRQWFDHWLKDAPATDVHESGALIFVMGINQWRAEADWPLARAVDTPLHLGAGGALTWEPPAQDDAPATYLYDPRDPVRTKGGNMVMSPDYPAGPFDQREAEARDDVLVFTTEPLTEDVEITGRVRATLFTATDGPSTDWVVRLCEVDADGVSRNIVDGITRVATEPGCVKEVEVDLWSTSIVVRAGHRIRVHVTSSNFPRWDRNLNNGEPVTEAAEARVARQQVYLDPTRPSRVILPIVPV